jgi:hypothetical protein
MLNNRIVKLATALVLGAAPLGVTVAAYAASGPAPGTGVTGACNMVFTHGGTQLNGGMQNAMSNDTAHGNAGMFHAVDVSGCS